jgi:hypothetical protein
MTPLTPPVGFGVSPSRRGIRWMWVWKIVWPTDAPQFMPTLNPVIELSASDRLFFRTLIRSSASRRSRSVIWNQSGACLFGAIRRCPSETGNPSSNASTESHSSTIRFLMLPEQNLQSDLVPCQRSISPFLNHSTNFLSAGAKSYRSSSSIVTHL